MRREAIPRVGRRGLRLRRLWHDPNPLRRTWDRLEALAVSTLVIAFVIGAPLVAILAGRWSYGASVGAEGAQQATLQQVPAVLLAGAPDPVSAAPVYPEVRAIWVAPDGALRSGEVLAPAGTQAGAAVPVWVDEAGRQTGPPLGRSQVICQAALDAVLAVVGLGLILLCAGMLARAVLDRRRLAAWESEWRRIGAHL
jgi:hypothetical protein